MARRMPEQVTDTMDRTWAKSGEPHEEFTAAAARRTIERCESD